MVATSFSLGLLGVCILICIIWAGVLFKVWQTVSHLERIQHVAPSAKKSVTAVVAARNEEHNIEHAVTSLLTQRDVDIRVVAVDDASTDRTLSRLQGVAHGEPRLLVVESAKVPTGWVARNYALELGQGRADGEFLLFTDADAFHSRRVVGHAIAAMEKNNLDHLAVHPRLEASTLLESIILPIYFLLCEFWFFDRRSISPDSGIGAGVGAFNLVRAEAYRLRGTHARIRGAVLGNPALGNLMREDGGRGTVMRAGTDIRMRPYRSLRQMYLGLKKGLLGAFGYSSLSTLGGGFALAAAGLCPLIMLIAALPLVFFWDTIPWGILPATLALVIPSVALLSIRSLVRFEPLAVLLLPVGLMFLSIVAFHAAIVFTVRGTIAWRGRRYGKTELRNVGM